MLIKICGLTRPGDAEAAIEAGADLLGFVFVPGTKRFVDPEASDWIRHLGGVEKVGVFRDQELDHVTMVRDSLGLDRVQLHGEEPDSWLDELGLETLRRVQPRGPDPWQRAAMLSGRCLPLFDPGAGDGVAFDWTGLRPRPTGLWVGIAGGLTPESVGAAVRAVRPAMVDVSTGVESALGIKDTKRVRAFIEAARNAVESAALERS
ncbi:MAG: phosphoribosylanthranilate isomerase [Thermoanaerobaculales bacterium]|jgi:phosphoribosylanthranilate isomerase|nr:phosphoribosylanthranilate isomerase [Thermoanaerobaculales bacterium]